MTALDWAFAALSTLAAALLLGWPDVLGLISRTHTPNDRKDGRP
ncbi:hypothetical protein [Streptomyces sp. DSM 40750]|nr:hypothetical protein [Streptomyces sp. DSM 40750]UUU21676.1 hypothetical protein JIX55_15840 [Streptomyces sp. DSM 40750]